jgi:hypothetical protein
MNFAASQKSLYLSERTEEQETNNRKTGSVGFQWCRKDGRKIVPSFLGAIGGDDTMDQEDAANEKPQEAWHADDDVGDLERACPKKPALGLQGVPRPTA